MYQSYQMRSRSKVEKSENSIKRSSADYDDNDTSNDVKPINGIYFCQRCNNTISPYRANAMILQFYCQTCGIRTIDFTHRSEDQCMISNKQFQIVAKKVLPNPLIVFDQSLPKIDVNCPECDYNQAAYMVITDEKEDRLIAKMFCLSTIGFQLRCGNTWELDPSKLIQGLYEPLPSTNPKLTQEQTGQIGKNIPGQEKITTKVPIQMTLKQDIQMPASQMPLLKLNLNIGPQMLY